MPVKPTEEVINAAKVKLNPHDVVQAIVNETPELARALVDAGLATEVPDDDEEKEEEQQ